MGEENKTPEGNGWEYPPIFGTNSSVGLNDVEKTALTSKLKRRKGRRKHAFLNEGKRLKASRKEFERKQGPEVEDKNRKKPE